MVGQVLETLQPARCGCQVWFCFGLAVVAFGLFLCFVCWLFVAFSGFAGTVVVMTPDEQLRFDEIVSGLSTSSYSPDVSKRSSGFMRRVLLWVVGFSLGMALLLVGVSVSSVVVGVSGFLIMLISAVFGLRVWRSKQPSEAFSDVSSLL